MKKKRIHGILRRKGSLWITLFLFIFSVTLHWIFGWRAYKHEQEEHHQPAIVSEYVDEMLKDTMENWQSEFYN